MDKKYSQNNNSKSSKSAGSNYFKDKFGKSKPASSKSSKGDFGERKEYKNSEGNSDEFGGFKGKKSFKPKFQDKDNNFKRKSSFRGDNNSFPKKRFDKDGDFSKGKSFGRDKNFDGEKPYRKDRSFDGEKSFRSDKPYNKDKSFGRDKNFDGEKPYRKDRSFDGGKSFRSDKPYNKDKSFGRDKNFDGEKPYRKDRTFDGEKSFCSDKPYNKDKSFGRDKNFDGEKPYRKDRSFDGEKSFRSDKPYNKDKSFSKDKGGSFDNEKPYKKEFGGDKPFEGKRDSKPKRFNVRKFEEEDLSFGNAKKPKYEKPREDEVEVVKSLDEPQEFKPKKWNKVDKAARGPKEKGFKYEEERRFKKPADINNYRSEPIEVEDDNTKPMPLNKYLAHCGVCSRRDAVDLVKSGEVLVNGNAVSEPGYKVDPLQDKVSYKGKGLNIQEDLIYILMNKPKGYITTMEDPQNRKTVWDLVKNNIDQRVFPVGRLDRNTTGLLLLTNDGQLAQKLSHPKYQIRKIYQATLDKNLTSADFEKILAGVVLEDGPAPVDSLSYLEKKNEIGLEIHSGKNRIVRRIFESLGYDVEKLDRVMYAGLTKKNILRGKFRFLSEQEVINLKFLN